ncbi:hypothetical protein [Vibrio mediterranei]|uniref:hypothetical protein n=1 Tax=Vibrio mediterranei TaxID=689 RepID=UPI004067C3BF
MKVNVKFFDGAKLVNEKDYELEKFTDALTKAFVMTEEDTANVISLRHRLLDGEKGVKYTIPRVQKKGAPSHFLVSPS